MSWKNHNNKIRLFDEEPPNQTNHRAITFFIYYEQKILFTLKMVENCCVDDLILSVKQKMVEKGLSAEMLVCLQSVGNEEVLDYSLLIGQYSLSNFDNFVSLEILYREEVRSKSNISLNDFYFKKCLGQGASALVNLVRHKSSGQLFALKQIPKQYFTEFKRLEQVLREKKIMVEFLRDSLFTARLVATFQSQNHLNFLLDFYPGGQLFFHLHSRRLTELEARKYFAQLVVAFQYIHECNIIYRDLKPQNIMIDINGHTRLTDFGLCKISYGKDDLTTSYCGSIQYMAPEVKESIGYSYSADFYTLGAFLYELVIGVPPYYNTTKLYFLQQNTDSFKRLVKALIQSEVTQRILSFEQIKQSQFMDGVDWEEVKNQRNEMPFKVNPHKTYIHEEFREIEVDEMNNKHTDEFQRLFNFFTFVNFKYTKFIGCYDLKLKEKMPVSQRVQSPRSSLRILQENTNKNDKFFRKEPSFKKKNKQKRERSVNPDWDKMKTLSHSKSASELIKSVLGKV